MKNYIQYIDENGEINNELNIYSPIFFKVLEELNEVIVAIGRSALTENKTGEITLKISLGKETLAYAESDTSGERKTYTKEEIRSQYKISAKLRENKFEIKDQIGFGWEIRQVGDSIELHPRPEALEQAIR